MKKLYYSLLSLIFLILVSISSFAQDNLQKIPIGDVIQEDGSIDPDLIRSGTVDPAGYRLEIAPDGSPRFLPTSTHIQKTIIENTTKTVSQNFGASDANWSSDFSLSVERTQIYAVAILGDRVFIGGDWEEVDGQSFKDFAVYDYSLNQWSNLGLNMDGCCAVFAIEVIGSDVYVVGDFYTSNGISHLAKWNGTSWSGIGNGQAPNLRSIAVAGGNVYVSGYFSSINGDPNMSYISYWDGSNWNPMTEGINNAARILKANSDGSRVYVGGYLGNEIPDGLGGTIPNTTHIAYWDTNTLSWSSLEGGTNNDVFDIEVDGTNIYMVGRFGCAMDVGLACYSNTSRIALWNEVGDTWGSVYGLNSALNSEIQSITKDGNFLYVSGYFDNTVDGLSSNIKGVAKYDVILSNGWQSMGQGITQDRWDEIKVDSDNGKIAAGGDFLSIDGSFTRRFSVFDGNLWNNVASGPTKGNNFNVRAVTFYNDQLIIGGWFDETGDGTILSNIASYDFSLKTWSAMNGGIDGEVLELEVHGSDLYAGGYFNVAGGVTTNGLAKWDGTAWTDIGALTGGIWALESDGTDLYVGGDFNQIGGLSAARGIARYNPVSGWSSLGFGLNFSPYNYPSVRDISIENGEIFVCGRFDQTGDAGMAMHTVAKFTGGAWSQVGSGLNEILSSEYREAGSIETINGEVYINHQYTDSEPRRASKLSLTNTWEAYMPGDYYDPSSLERRGNDLVIGGYFWPNNSEPHSPMITILKEDGTFTKIDKGANSTVRDIAVQGDQIAFVGYFDRVNSDIPSDQVGLWTSPTITTGTLSATSAQGRQEIQVPFTITGSFDDDNLFQVQISDNTGDFGNGQIIGALEGGTEGTITAIIPLNVDGTGFKIRVIASTEAQLIGEQDFTIIAGGQPFNYYWVGDAGNWSDLAHWSSQSGGAADYTALPTKVDNIYFDENSFTQEEQQVTVDLSFIEIGNMDWTGATGVPSFQADYQNEVNIYGDVVFADSMRLYVGQMFFKTSEISNIDFPNFEFSGRPNIYLEGPGTFNLSDSITTQQFYLSDGTLNTNGHSIFASNFYGTGSNAVLNLGSSSLYTNYLRLSSLTFNADASTIYHSWEYGSSFEAPGFTFNHVILQRESYLYGNTTFETLELVPGSIIRFQQGTIQSVNNLIAIGQRSQPISIRSDSDGSQASLSVPVTGTVSAKHLFINDNEATGGATFLAEESFLESNVTGWTSTPWVPLDYYWIGNGGDWDDISHWSSTSGGSADMTDLPGSVDNIIFDGNSFDMDEQIVNLPTNNEGIHERVEVGDLSWVGVTNFPTFYGEYYATIYTSGNVAFSPDMTSDIKYIQFVTRNNTGIRTIGANNFIAHNLQFFSEGEWVLADSVAAYDIFMQQGIFDTNDQPFYVHYFSADSWNPMSVKMGSSDVYILKYFDLRVRDFVITTEFLNASIHTDLTQQEGEGFYLNDLNYGRIITHSPALVAQNGDRAPLIEFFGNGSIDTLELLPGSRNFFQEGTTITIGDIVANGSDEQPITISSQKNGETFNFMKSTGTVNGNFLNLRDNIAMTDNDAIFNAFKTLVSGTVQGWIVETGLDGSVSETTLSFNKAVPGTDIGIYARVTNSGDAILQQSNLRFYISEDQLWDENDVQLGTEITINNLSIGESNIVTQNLDLPSSLPNPEYFMLAVYDPDDINTGEIRNGNNYEPIKVTITDELPPQELIFSVLKDAGGSEAEVANDVAGDSDGNTYITGYFSGVADFGGSQLTALGASDIFLSKLDVNGNYLWTTQIGSSSNNEEQGRSIAFDANNNPVVVGYFDQEAIFYDDDGLEAIRLTSQGETDGFVAKFDKATGSVLWANRFGGTDFDEASDAVVQGDNVYVTGFSRGSVNLAGISLDGTGSLVNYFVARISNITGAGQGAIIDGLGYESYAETIALNPDNGNIFIGGYFERNITIGNVNFNSDNQSEDGFIARYDQNLNFNNAVRGGGYASDRIYTLSYDASSNILYAGGDLFGYFCFPDWCTYSTNDNEDAFVASLNPDDFSTNWMNSTYVSSDGSARIRSITVDEEGAIYFAGAIKGFLETGTKAIATQGDFDGLIGRYFSNGGFDFVDGFGGTGDDVVFGLDVAANKIQMSGSYFGALDIPNVGRLISKGNRDVMVATASTDRVAPTYDPSQLIFPEYYTLGSTQKASVGGVFDNGGIKEVIIHYRPLTQPSDTDLTAQGNAPGNTDYWEFDLSVISSDALGAEYYFEIIDFDGNATDTEAGTTWLQYGDGVNLSIPKVGVNSEDFRMISFPLEIAARNASNVFGTVYGNNNDSEDRLYLLYRFSGDEVVSNKSGQINLGEGYWFLTSQSSPSVINSGPGNVPKAREGGEATKSVNLGWNLIGNPYTKSISATEFFAANPQLEQRLEYYNGGNYSNESTLEPFRGYFVKANSTEAIKFPVVSSSGGRVLNSEEPVLNELTEPEWGVALSVRSGKKSSDRFQIGMSPRASDLKDDMDLSSLPKLFNYADLSFSHDEEGLQLMKDVAETKNGHRWSAIFESNLEGELVTLEWDNSYWGTNDLTIALYDKNAERIINMRDQTKYEFRNSGIRHFEIIYGTEQFILENVMPEQLMVHTYPNPFRDATTIEFALPASSNDYKVRMEIYNSMGQWVTTVLDDVLTEGFHKASWNARNQSGTEMRQGIYIYRLRASGSNGTLEKSGRLILK